MFEVKIGDLSKFYELIGQDTLYYFSDDIKVCDFVLLTYEFHDGSVLMYEYVCVHKSWFYGYSLCELRAISSR